MKKIINLYEYFRVGVRMLTPEYFLLKNSLLYGWLYCNNTKGIKRLKVYVSDNSVSDDIL